MAILVDVACRVIPTRIMTFYSAYSYKDAL